MRSLHLALLEVRSYLKDKGDLAFSILLPVAVLAIMIGAFGQQSRFNGTANIVDQDGGPYAAQVIQTLKATPGMQVNVLTAADADAKLNNSSIVVAAYLPQGFSDKLGAGQPVTVTFKQRGSGGQEGQIAESIIRGAVQEVAARAQVHRQVQAALTGSGIAATDIDTTVDKFLAREDAAPTVQVIDQDLGTRPDPLHEFLPGILTMFALFSLSLRAQVMVEERQKGTLERLLTTRLGLDQLFLGKFLAGCGKGIFQVVFLLALAAAVFHIFTVASFFSTLLVAIIFVAAVSAIGLVIASVARTRDQATWIGVVFTLVMSMLGGTFFEVKSGFLHIVSLGTINHYANEALKTLVNRTGSLGDVSMQIAVIAGVGLLALVAARLLFKAVPGGGR